MNSPQLVVSWKAVVRELRLSHGMSLRDIGREVGIAHETVRTYQYEIARPKHAEGERILDLWMRITKRDRNAVPQEPAPISAAQLRSV